MYNVDIDFHLEFDIDPARMDLDEVCRQTERHRMGGRVAIVHVTKLSALPPARLAEVAHRLAGAGVAVRLLPASVLFPLVTCPDPHIPPGVTHTHTLQQPRVT